MAAPLQPDTGSPCLLIVVTIGRLEGIGTIGRNRSSAVAVGPATEGGGLLQFGGHATSYARVASDFVSLRPVPELVNQLSSCPQPTGLPQLAQPPKALPSNHRRSIWR